MREVNPGSVPEVIVTVLNGIEGTTISRIEVGEPLITVGTIEVNTGSVPEVIVIVVGAIDGSTT